MTENIDDEVNAIKSVLKAIEPLTPEARARVVDYVLKRMGLALPAETESPVAASNLPRLFVEASEPGTPLHLKDFAKQKKPKSANEMAAVVAYYLAELAPPPQRKRTISADDVRTYFKIGDYPLPEVKFTLPNAKYAGYFDALGNGEYQLNAVGHNLVAHSLPRTKDGAAPIASRKKRRKKSRSVK